MVYSTEGENTNEENGRNNIKDLRITESTFLGI
jgi:hypothetical protein